MLLWNAKDGGPESRVWCWGFELKRLCSVLLLKFDGNSRDAFHSHAFNSRSWVLRGELHEHQLDTSGLTVRRHTTFHLPSWRWITTLRSTFHMVDSVGVTWVLTLRGPWANDWREYLPAGSRHIRLSHGRKVLP